MRDLEKLINDLRIHATGECEDCSLYDPDPFLPCSEQLAKDTADAIEELVARIQKLEYVIRLLHIEKETFKTFSGL